MALQWKWDEKCGEAVVKSFDGKEYTKSLYEGNAFLIFLNEWEEDGKNMYSLYSFMADEQHAKNCLGLTKGYDNMFTDTLVKLRINKKKCRQWKKVITLFVQAFDNLTIDVYTEDEKND